MMSLPETLRSTLSEYVRPYLAAGFWDLDDVTCWAFDHAEGLEEHRDEVTALVRAMWQDRLAEQARWPDTGDYGRLQSVFEQLESESIVARMCFSCCGTCAYHDIASEATWVADGGIREIGYVYFHQQDAYELGYPEPAVYLGFGSFNPHPALPEAIRCAATAGDEAAMDEALAQTDVMVGTRVVEIATGHGLSVTWSGSAAERIEVRLPQWRKPLPQ
ncbi:hypothetical protein OKHIL_52570 [Mycolicibacterium mageritense]|nr:hypothetical protein EB73_05280 [Mycobacterium sp. SWH-M3]